MYNKKSLEIFTNLTNVGVLQGASAVGQYINPETSDNFKLYVKVEDGKIIASSFKAFSGVVGVALMSTLTELVKDLKIEELANFDMKSLEEKLALDDKDRYLLEDVKSAILATVEDYQKRLEKEQKAEKKAKK